MNEPPYFTRASTALTYTVLRREVQEEKQSHLTGTGSQKDFFVNRVLEKIAKKGVLTLAE
jgi:hypothetical protein